MTVIRVIELITEAVPGTVIQAAAMFSVGGERSFAAFSSLASSVVTASFMSALMSFDWDRDPKNRGKNPLFYGYVTGSRMRKVAIFVALFYTSAFNLIVRAMGWVLLQIKGVGIVIAFLVLEMLTYLGVKAIRGDLWHRIKIYGTKGVVASSLMRVLTKAVADWTACVQFRSPGEVRMDDDDGWSKATSNHCTTTCAT